MIGKALDLLGFLLRSAEKPQGNDGLLAALAEGVSSARRMHANSLPSGRNPSGS